VVFGFLRDGLPWLSGAPLPVNYIVPHDLDFFWGRSDQVHGDRRRFRVVVGHRVLIDRFVAMDAPADARSGEKLPDLPSQFSGALHAVEPVHDAPPPEPSVEFSPAAAPR
jgi:hypothetical protein